MQRKEKKRQGARKKRIKEQKKKKKKNFKVQRLAAPVSWFTYALWSKFKYSNSARGNRTGGKPLARAGQELPPFTLRGPGSEVL